MSALDQARTHPDSSWWRWFVPAALIAAAGAIVIAAHPHLEPILHAKPAVQIHLAFAVAMLALGVVMLNTRKGRAFHRAAGWIWAGLIMLVALSSLFITQVTPGHWSWIHISSGVALILTPFALWAARVHDVKAHRTAMMWLFYFFTLVAAALTFLPGRLMWQVFLGP